jgi:triosephosphate isomerase
MRTPLLAANWKMHKTLGETRDFLSAFIPLVNDVSDAEIVIAPPFTALSTAADMIRTTRIRLAAQDVFYEPKGAFTGEVSPGMLTDVGCAYVIIGHSERRQYFSDTDDVVNRKIRASLEHGLKVILCIGESLEERERGQTFDVLKRELEVGLKDIAPEKIVIAYEPIWAIGTGKTATPEQAQEAHRYVRERLSQQYGKAAQDIRILYGGSVTPENVASLMVCADVDGGLVGGASLKADSFTRIVKYKG